MKFKFFLFLAIFSSPCFSESIYDCFKGQEWKFIEFMLIKKVDREKQKIPAYAKQRSILAATHILGLFLCGKIMNYIDDHFSLEFSTQPVKNFCWPLLFSYILVDAGLSYFLHYNWVEYRITYNFIANWPKYKEYSPVELHSTFDVLHQKYLDKTLTNDEINEMAAIVEELVKSKKQ